MTTGALSLVHSLDATVPASALQVSSIVLFLAMSGVAGPSLVILVPFIDSVWPETAKGRERERELFDKGC